MIKGLKIGGECMKNILVEVCCESVQDCIIAEQYQADRIELNCALHLGGLTPSIGVLTEAKKKVNIPIITMVRSRGGGFHYTEEEIAAMLVDAKTLIQNGADGLVFGFLNQDSTINTKRTKQFVEICKAAGVEAVFHRAFDLVEDPREAIESLIACGINRILTSGLEESALQGRASLKMLMEAYGSQIEICAGAGINASNVTQLIKEGKVVQVHGSFKAWFRDSTTSNAKVSYAYSEHGDYEGVDSTKLVEMMQILKK